MRALIVLVGLAVLTLLALLFATVPTDTPSMRSADAKRIAPPSDAGGLDRNSAPSAAPETAATGPATSQRHRAKGSAWVDVQVVDEQGATVPGATVMWYDERGLGKSQVRPRQQRELPLTPEAIAEQYGYRTTADADGRATVTLAQSTWLLGKAKGLRGQLELRNDTPAAAGYGYRLLLTRDPVLRVQVLDPAGRGCPDVAVVLAARVEPNVDLDVGEDQPVAHTNAQGFAILRNLSRVRELVEADQENTALGIRYFVHIQLPGYAAPAVRVPSLRAPPTEPVILRMPATGRVRIRLADVPAGFAAAAAAIAIDLHGSHHDGGARSHPRPDGWVVFEQVPIGQELVAAGLGRRITFFGPTQAGQTVDAVLPADPEEITMRMRLVDEHGQPIARESIRLEARGDGLRCAQTIQTDSSGYAWFAAGRIGRTTAAPSLQSGELFCIDSTSTRGFATLPPRALHAGCNDLGEVVFGDRPLMAAGRMMDERADGAIQPAQPPIWVHLERRDERGRGRWHACSAHTSTVTDDGDFRVLARAIKGARYRLRVDGPNVPQAQLVEITPGSDDIVVRIPRGHPATASLWLPYGADYRYLRCRLLPATPTAANATSNAPPPETLLTHPVHIAGERYEARWPAAPAGRYHVSLELWGRQQPLRVIENVVVPAPAPRGGDPRLADIDLRDEVQCITVRFADALGKPLPVKGLLAYEQPSQSDLSLAYVVHGPSVCLPVPRGLRQLRALIQGHPPTPIRIEPDRGRSQPITVRLHDWPTVAVRVSSPADVPSDLQFAVAIAPSERERGHYQTLERRIAVGDVLHRSWTARVADGLATLPLKGRSTLRLFLQRRIGNLSLPRPSQNRVELAAQPKWIEPGTNAVTLRISEADLKQALATIAGRRR
ncbi:MAG: hypothetical protein AB8H80_15280 [Planctomycetota bacterium]